jgi:tetratricopeptide (TPR) repeat protein
MHWSAFLANAAAGTVRVRRKIMSKDYKTFLSKGDWDGAIAALAEKDKANWSTGDYANRAYARCFQATNAHKDGNYDDAIEAASQALLKDCSNNRALCIRAYAYYLNNNYEAAITDCEKVIEQILCDGDTKKAEMKRLGKIACDKIRAADEAKEEVEAAEKAVEDAVTAQEAYCAALRPAAFAHELLGMMYSSLGNNLEASKQYKLALLSRQTDIESASPLLMDAYRNARTAVKSAY